VTKQELTIQKIALFLPSLNGGGAERVFVTLANSLAARGIAIDLVLSNATGEYLSMLDKRVRVINLCARSVFFSLPALVKYLRAETPQALLSAVENANTWAIIAGWIARVATPVVITEHQNWSQVLANQPTLKEKLLFQIARYVYPRADLLVAVSDGIRADLLAMLKLEPRKVTRIYNPAVPDALAPLSLLPVEHPWVNNRQAPLLLSIGRLAKQKDFQTLLLAFAQVKKLANCRLIILGEGSERKNLEASIRQLGLENEVQMPGFVENPYAWLAKSDLFIMSSIHEGLPTVLIEAMACGTPVISTNCISGPAEILDNGRYGDLVPVNDPQALAAAILKNINAPRDDRRLRERAGLFSVNKAADAYLEMLARVIHRAQ
jgi:glycosyltransferase involved in cell wall biosynthesis